jgi:hypothetical protein
MINLFLKLVAGHFIADIAFQSESLARQKNPHAPPPKAYDPAIHGPMYSCWPYYMATHASIHAVMVYFITGSSNLAIIEFFAHYFIDTLKSYFRIPIHFDQFLHIVCKFIYVLYPC